MAAIALLEPSEQDMRHQTLRSDILLQPQSQDIIPYVSVVLDARSTQHQTTVSAQLQPKSSLFDTIDLTIDESDSPIPHPPLLFLFPPPSMISPLRAATSASCIASAPIKLSRTESPLPPCNRPLRVPHVQEVIDGFTDPRTCVTAAASRVLLMGGSFLLRAVPIGSREAVRKGRGEEGEGGDETVWAGRWEALRGIICVFKRGKGALEGRKGGKCCCFAGCGVG